MTKSSYHILLLTLIVFSTVLGFSSQTYFGLWVAMELGTLSFLGMSSVSGGLGHEASMKYFLIQSSSSLAFLFFVVVAPLYPVFYTASSLALSVKVGLSPFHMWVPVVSEGLSWEFLLMLFTFLKVPPFFGLYFSMFSSSVDLILLLVLLSCLVGSLSGWNETCFRKLMSFSSVSHSGWILAALVLNTYLWVLYIIVYAILLSWLFYLFYSLNMYHVSDLSKLKSFSLRTSVSVSVLSLMGLPPLTGFTMKWATVGAAGGLGYLMVFYVILMSSGFMLGYYIRMVLFSYINSVDVFISSWGHSSVMAVSLFLSMFGLWSVDLLFSLLHLVSM